MPVVGDKLLVLYIVSPKLQGLAIEQKRELAAELEEYIEGDIGNWIMNYLSRKEEGGEDGT